MSEASQIDVLLRQLNEHKLEARQTAIIDLVAMGDTVIDSLLEIIKSGEPTIPHDYARTHAVDILGKLKFVDAIDLLTKATTDASPSMRKHSALALGNIGDDASVPIIMRLLREDSSPEVREAAAIALGNFCRPDVFQGLINALADDDDWVREVASDTLIGIGEQSRRHVVAALKYPNEAVRTECRYIIDILDDDSYDVCRLWAGLSDKNFEIRLLTINGLWNLCSEEVVPGLKIALDDTNRHIRLAAVLALQCIGTQEAIQIIATAKADKDATIRKLVQRVVGR